MSKTLFEKIIAREIPATIVYEDDLVPVYVSRRTSFSSPKNRLPA